MRPKNNNGDDVYGAVIMVPAIAESSPGSFDECSLSTRGLPTLKPSQPTWPLSSPVGCYRPHLPSPFISITHCENWYSFCRPTRVEGWVDLGTGVRVRSPCPRLYIAVAVTWYSQLPEVRFKPGYSHTADTGATIRPLRPKVHRSRIRILRISFIFKI